MEKENYLGQRRSTYKEIVKKAREAKNSREKSAPPAKQFVAFSRSKRINSAGTSFLMKQLTALSDKNKQLMTTLVQSKQLNNGLEQSLQDFQHTHMAMLMKLNSRQVQVENLEEKLSKTQSENKKLKTMLINIKQMLNEEISSDIEEENANTSASNCPRKPGRIQVIFGNETENKTEEFSIQEEIMTLDQNISIHKSSFDEDDQSNLTLERRSPIISDSSFDPDKFMFNFDENICGDKVSESPDSISSNCHNRRINDTAVSNVGKKRKQSGDSPSNESSCEAMFQTNDSKDKEDMQTPLAPRISAVMSSRTTSEQNDCDELNNTEKKIPKSKKSRQSKRGARKSQKENLANGEIQNPEKRVRLDIGGEDKENKSSRKTLPLPEKENNSIPNRYSGSDIDSCPNGRSRRTKNRVNYLEPSLTKKLRQGDKMGDGWLAK